MDLDPGTIVSVIAQSGGKEIKSIALGVGAGLGTIGPGIGVGYIFGKVIESVTRQPEMRVEITSIQWLGFALTGVLREFGVSAALHLPRAGQDRATQPANAGRGCTPQR